MYKNAFPRRLLVSFLLILSLNIGQTAFARNSASDVYLSGIFSRVDLIGSIFTRNSVPRLSVPDVKKANTPAATPLEVQAAFTPGNLVINRIGNGTTSLGSSNAFPISIVEVTTGGVSTGNVISLPSFSTGGNNQGGFTDTGSNAAIGGFLHRSVDGRYLSLMGIDAQVGTGTVTNTTAPNANRNLAKIDAAGNVVLEAKLSSTYSTGTPRSAITTNGDDFWLGGSGSSGNGVRYVDAATGLPTTSTAIQTGEMRNVAIFAGILFSSTVNSISYHNAPNAPPTSTTAGIAINTGGELSTNSGSFIFLDRSPSVGATNLNGLDTLYVNDASDVEKFEWTGSAWTYRGQAASGTTLFGLAAILNGNNVDLYVTESAASDNRLRKVTDSSGFGGTFAKANADFANLATAGANYAFRGIALAPVLPAAPEIVVEDSANIPEGGTSDFGNQTVSTSSVPRTFTIRNTGNANLTLTKPFAKDGTHSAEFVVDTDDTDAVILPDESTTFTVTFTPTGTSQRTAAIHITNNDSDENPFDINLTGTGIPPPSISSVPVIRAAGESANSTIGNVIDAVDELETLEVTVNGGASAMQNGVTVSGINVDNAGVVTAEVAAAAGAADAAFTLTVTNSNMQSAVSTLQVIVLNECPTTETWTQQARVTASDGSTGAQFGLSVAISGDTAIVGANGDEGARGAAYVFARSSGVWSQQAKLTASDGAGGHQFGRSVAISGDTAVVGAHLDPDLGVNAGSAYVFTRSGTVWSEQAKLTASNGEANDLFGFSVGISGDNAVVGAWVGDGSAGDSGAAYVFARTGTTWSEQQILAASDGSTGDRLGWSVAISGDTAVVGANYENELATQAGAAYVFERSGTVWSEQEKLTGSDGAASDEFGYSVAISGNTVVVGAVLDDDLGGNSGSAYVFTRTGTDWAEQQKLTASDAAGADFFGFSVGISGDTAIIGARNDDSGQGSAYIFKRSLGAWSEQDKLTASDGAASDNFGNGVAISGDTAVAGAFGDDDLGSNSGSAYFFENICTTPEISGNVRLQNRIDRPVPLDDVLVPDVDLDAAGAPPVSGTTGVDGKYSLSGFGAGPYTVTPSKANQVYTAPNGVFIDDASLVARRVVGLEPDFTVHQIAAADVSGVAGVSSYDATLIARWVVGLTDAGNRSGKWTFTPSSVDHGVVAADIIQNYDALLFGDVNGDFEGAPPELTLQQFIVEAADPVSVSVPNIYAQSGSTVVVPLKIAGLNGASVRSYQFDIEYDPAVVTPAAQAADLGGTIGDGLNIIYNVPSPGLLKVAVYGIYGVVGDGIYANLQFTAMGGAGNDSQLLVKNFRLNDGKTKSNAVDGSVFVTSGNGNTVSGRLVTTAGQGVRNTQVTITGPIGVKRTTFSSSLGYFEFGSLTAGGSYSLTAQSRRYRFATVGISPSNGITSVEMLALE